MNRYFLMTMLLLILVGSIFSFSTTHPVNATGNLQNDGDSIQRGDRIGSLDVDGWERLYLAHIPQNYDPDEAVPLIISFHEYESNPAVNAQLTRLSEKSEEQGFIVAYPAGTGDPLVWYTLHELQDGAPDNVKFIDMMINQLLADYNIDPTRIYLTGFSNGGGMANRVACDLSDRVAAMAIVAGGHFNDDSCEPELAVPIYAIHARLDTDVLYDGGDITMSIPDWSLDWAKYNGCDMTPIDETDTSMPINVVTWHDCKGDADVTLVSMNAIGHSWLPQMTDDILAFFDEHTLIKDQEQPEHTLTEYTAGDIVNVVFSMGTVREYTLHLPPQFDGETPLPLVISIHGYTGSMQGNMRATSFKEKSDEEGFIVVFPQGRPVNAGDLGWYSRPNLPIGFPDDIEFFRDLIDHLSAEIPIDRSRVYATGLSMGGGMTHRLGCDLSEYITAIAPVAGAHTQGDPCEPQRPVPTLALHGRLDRIVPYEGLDGVNDSLVVWSADWAARNGCSPESTTTDIRDDLTLDHWSECDDDAEVLLYSYANMGHSWPVDGTDIIWEFFSQQTMTAP
jgi:polyhydroxybutyrate depolymerase